MDRKTHEFSLPDDQALTFSQRQKLGEHLVGKLQLQPGDVRVDDAGGQFHVITPHHIDRTEIEGPVDTFNDARENIYRRSPW